MVSFSAGFARADEITLRNGDRLSGTVVKAEDGMLILRTGYADPARIRIKTRSITDLSTEAAVPILMHDGSVLRGRVVRAEGGVLFVETPDGDVKPVPWDAVAILNPPPARWKGNITAGAGLDAGNTDRLSTSLSIEASRRAYRHRITSRIIYNYAEEEDTVTARNLFGTVKYDYFLSKVYFNYFGVEFQSDTFRDLDFSIAAGPGIGYQVWDTPAKSLLFETGVTYLLEDFDQENDRSGFTGRLAGDLSLGLWGVLTLAEKAAYWPNLERLREFRFRNEASLITAVGAQWALKLTNILEHKSDPPAGVLKTDVFWILGLQYTF